MRHPHVRLAAALILAVAACSSPAGNDDNPGGGAGPVVQSIVPPNGAMGVSATTAVTVTFDKPVDPASVTSAALSVGTATGTISVTGAVATFTPSAPFPEGSTQNVTVTGVRDMGGRAMGAAFSSSFGIVAQALSANAGPDRDASFGQSVTLDGSASTGSGATYTWTQIEGTPVGALSGQTPAFTAPESVGRLRFELAVSAGSSTARDTVAVLVLEDHTNAFFVAPSGSDANAGTRSAPFATIQAALNAADNAGNGGDVYVAAGAYAGSLTLRSRVSVYGGFEPGTWRREIAAFRSEISGGPTAVVGTEANSLTIEGLSITAANATDSAQSSVGIMLDNSATVVIRRNVIVAGAGFRGRNGVSGVAGNPGSNGGSGTVWGNCPPNRTGGGGGGSPIGNTGGGGGTGGAAGGFNGSQGAGSGGAAGIGGPTGSNGGGGGFTTIAVVNGGAGSAATSSSLSAGAFLPGRAGTGGAGSQGWGGGGGGGGGGGVVFVCGGGGGGGGGGGQRGTGGTGGEGGGASIGIALSGTSVATIEGNEITTAAGGRGGNGGAGGAGGGGGGGGSGGAGTTGIGRGGNGADGSRGGHGGGGGGGRGGSSYGVLEAANASSTRTGNTIVPGPAGDVGTGGTSSGSAGQTGITGEALDYKKLT